jgi:hypothetical protein
LQPRGGVFAATLIAASLVAVSGCAHMSDPCSNKPLQRTASPDAALVLATYHRECATMVYTVTALEKPSPRWRARGDVLCYVASWRGRHPVEAVWTSANVIAVSTTDRLERADVNDSSATCPGITVRYGVQFRNERQQADDPETVGKIRRALAELGPCIDAYYRPNNPGDGPVASIRQLIDRGEYRSAVELLLSYAGDAACRPSQDTYAALVSLSETFDLKPEFLQRVLTPGPRNGG